VLQTLGIALSTPVTLAPLRRRNSQAADGNGPNDDQDLFVFHSSIYRIFMCLAAQRTAHQNVNRITLAIRTTFLLEIGGEWEPSGRARSCPGTAASCSIYRRLQITEAASNKNTAAITSTRLMNQTDDAGAPPSAKEPLSMNTGRDGN